MKEKILKGGLALSVRQIISFPLNAAGLALCSVFLSPSDFGIAAILTIFINLAFILVDLGSTGALIQYQSIPSEALLRKIRIYKTYAAILCFMVFYFLAPKVAHYYNLPAHFYYLFPLCSLVAWSQSLRGYQSIWLQRKLEWQSIARIELIEIFAYNFVLICCAYFFRNPIAFILSLGVRMAVGAMLLNIATKRKECKESSKAGNFWGVLKFGIPYQTTTALSMVQKSINPIIVGSIAGVDAIGHINWSQYLVSLPILPIQPLFAFLFSVIAERMREKKNDSEVIQYITNIGSLFISLISLIMILSLPYIVHHYFKKWEDAVPVASILLLSNTIAYPNSIITTHLSAKGFSLAWMNIVVIETVLMWVLGGGLTLILGTVGFGVGMLLAMLIVLVIVRRVSNNKTHSNIKISYNIILLLISTISILIVKTNLFHALQNEELQAIIQMILGIAIFSALLGITSLKRIRMDYLFIKSNLISRLPQKNI